MAQEITQEISAYQDFTVNASDGSAVTPVDLKGVYERLVIRCEDLTNIGTAVSFTIQVASAQGETLVALDSADFPYTFPASAFEVAFDVSAVKHCRIVLNVASAIGDTTFKIRGVRRAIDN